MRDTFPKAFDMTVSSEGGFQNDPKDRGNWTTGVIGQGTNKGTKFGVSAMAYPHLDIRNLTVDAVRFIYCDDYWDAAQCDLWPKGVDYFVFDAAVNHGPSRAVKMLQQAVGTSADGQVGPGTKAAVRSAHSVRELIIKLGVVRDQFFDDLDNKRFEDGWRKRAFEVSFNAYDLAIGKL